MTATMTPWLGACRAAAADLSGLLWLSPRCMYVVCWAECDLRP